MSLTGIILGKLFEKANSKRIGGVGRTDQSPPAEERLQFLQKLSEGQQHQPVPLDTQSLTPNYDTRRVFNNTRLFR